MKIQFLSVIVTSLLISYQAVAQTQYIEAWNQEDFSSSSYIRGGACVISETELSMKDSENKIIFNMTSSQYSDTPLIGRCGTKRIELTSSTKEELLLLSKAVKEAKRLICLDSSVVANLNVEKLTCDRGFKIIQ